MNLFYCYQKILIALGLFTCFIFSSGCFWSKKYTVSNAHAHNDYVHPVPFYTAYNAGFGSIEADVFPVNGILFVAHDKKDIQPERTLKALYLMPALKAVSTGTSRKFIFLVDIKENYKIALSLLIRELQPLLPYLSTPEKDHSITVLISGERPSPAEYKNYPDYIFFDDDHTMPHSKDELKRVRLVSLPFNKITEWKGETKIDRHDKKKLEHIIDSVHSAGKPVRFWAAPDTKISWKLQMKLHADIIGTDKIDELANYLRQHKR